MTLLRKPKLTFTTNRKRFYPLLVLFVAAVSVALVGVYHWYLRAKTVPDMKVEVNLLNPDAYLATQNLSLLPKDLLAAPVLRDLDMEELFFYYRDDEGRLGLEGALRRISFEHELNLGDRFVAMLLDRPARIAFWKSRDGRLGRWLMVVRREGLVPVLENLAKAALADSQLRIAGTLPGQADTSVFELRHGPSLKLYFASVGEHLLVFSDSGILMQTGAAELEKINRLLTAKDPAELWTQGFNLDAQPHLHTLAVSTNYLSLGYQALFPALRALCFNFDQNNWSTRVSAASAFPSPNKLWQALPDHPALCAAVPVDPERIAELLSKVVSEDDAADLAGALEPPAAICWYDKAKLYAPLVVIRKNTEASLKIPLHKLFKATIGTHEAGVKQSVTPSAIPAQLNDKGEAAKASPGADHSLFRISEDLFNKVMEPFEKSAQHAAQPSTTPALRGEKGEAAQGFRVVYHTPFEISEDQGPNGTVWRRDVSSPYGTRPSAESGHSANMRSKRYFSVALAEWKDALLFSPDAALVDDAIAALEGRYPALIDALPAGSETAVVLYPDRLVAMAETAVLDSLPSEREPVFRANVSERLLPQLEKLKDARIMLLPAPQGKTTWEPLQWSDQR